MKTRHRCWKNLYGDYLAKRFSSNKVGINSIFLSFERIKDGCSIKIYKFTSFSREIGQEFQEEDS